MRFDRMTSSRRSGGLRAWPRRPFGRLIAICLGLFALLVAAGPGDDDGQWRERLLSPALKEDLRRKLEKFELLDDAEKQRLRELHSKVSASPDRERLEEVMLQYHEWLKTLAGKERAELLQLPPEEKIAQIKRLMHEQRQQRFGELVKTPLEPEDVRGIFGWLDQYVDNHEQELLVILPEELRERISQPGIPEGMRRRWVLMNLGRRTPGTQLPAPADDELKRLTEKLSPDAKAALGEVTTSEEKLELVREWVRAAVASRFVPQVSHERLTKYYRENHNRFDPKEREKLESLPPEQFYEAVRQRYFQDRRGPPWRGRRGDGDHFGGRPSRGREDRDRDRDGDRPRRHGDRDRSPERPGGPRGG